MAANPFSNFSNDVSLYIAKKTLSLAMKQLAVYGVCDKVKLPKNNGRTFQYTRYERVPLPQSPLSEGVSPSGSQMSISTVQAVMDQWGDVVILTDVAIDSVMHPVLQKAIEVLALQAAETVDREIIKVLMSGTNVYFPNAITARASLTSADKMSSAVVGKVVSNLRSAGARGYDGHLYVGVIHPFAEEDITVDATFVAAAQYSDIKRLVVNEIGTWKGVRWISSNTLPGIRLLTGASGASSATAGSLTAATAYDFKVSVVDANTGFETYMSAKIDVSTGMGETSIDITLPALPSGATAGSTFNIYAGADDGTLRLASSGNAASAVVNIGSIPTSGTVAQASPPASLRIFPTFIFGKEAVSCVELNKLRSYLTPGAASDSDPLAQRRKAGWKCDFKAVINNEQFMARVEHNTTNGS